MLPNHNEIGPMMVLLTYQSLGIVMDCEYHSMDCAYHPEKYDDQMMEYSRRQKVCDSHMMMMSCAIHSTAFDCDAFHSMKLDCDSHSMTSDTPLMASDSPLMASDSPSAMTMVKKVMARNYFVNNGNLENLA